MITVLPDIKKLSLQEQYFEINKQRLISSLNGRKKLKLLLVYSLHPTNKTVTLPEWIKEAIRLYYSDFIEVYACGPNNEISIQDDVNFYDKVNKVIKEKDIDILFDIEGGSNTLDFTFKRFPKHITIPKAFWAIDTHQFLHLEKEKAKYFDVVLSAQRNVLPEFGKKSFWMPAGASIYEQDYHVKRDINCAFIGSIVPVLHRERKVIIEYLKTQIQGFQHFNNVFLREKAKLASRIKIMVNQSLRNDINFRVFESMACGCMLITDKIKQNGFEDIFKDGEDLVTFETKEELKDKILYYLKNDEKREEIAKRGQEKVLTYFTHEKILKYIFNIFAENLFHKISFINESKSKICLEKEKYIDYNKESNKEDNKKENIVEMNIDSKEYINDINDIKDKNVKTNTKCWCGSLTESFSKYYDKCLICGTFINKNKDQEFKKFYGFTEYWHNYQENVSKHPSIEKRAINDFRDRVPVWFNTLMKYKNIKQINSILEIGCAPGSFLKYCKDQDRDNNIKTISGVEVDQRTCDFIENTFKFPKGSIISGLFPDVKINKKYDVICGFDLFEHLINPSLSVKKIKSLLKKDGIFFFQTPCYRGEDEEWVQFREDEHMYLYNENNIKKLFNVFNMKIIDILPGFFKDDMFVIGKKG
jgi:SAM-dependent methyltransferase/glycosyltransferase involved in cell wall biosynthesis